MWVCISIRKSDAPDIFSEVRVEFTGLPWPQPQPAIRAGDIVVDVRWYFFGDLMLGVGEAWLKIVNMRYSLHFCIPLLHL
jgi:hypothetical protein